MGKLDFQAINEACRVRLASLLETWLPGGRVNGNEYVCGNLNGGNGRSLSVNVHTGVWKDFATDDCGTDPVSLFAAINDLGQGEAAKRLIQELGIKGEQVKQEIIEIYDFDDAKGRLLFQVVRYKPKDFRQRRPDGKGGWIWNVKGLELVPYRLPEVLRTKAVFICEGEKDCNRLAEIGLTATTCAQGAGKWRPEYSKYFQSKRVCILPDNDVPGRKHAQQIAKSLHGMAEVVKVLMLPGLKEKGDVSDWLSNGGTKELLLEQAKAAPQWTPGEDESTHPKEHTPSFLPPPPPVPLEAFPSQLQAIIKEAAEAFVVPLEVPVCAVLALASACVGRARGIIIKESWASHANLYLSLVGKSGTGKSPCASAILNSIYKVDHELHEEWEQACADFQLEKERYQESIRQYRKGEVDNPGPAPEKPKRRQIFVDDATVESLTDALADNPRGILWLRDELAGLLLDLDKYQGKEGSTKNRLMQAYDSGPWKVNRINQGRTGYIPHAALSIFGTVQPAALADLFCGKDAATGFLPRFLFVRFVPEKPSLWTDDVFSNDSKGELDRITRALLKLDFQPDETPVFIGVSCEAKQLYVSWHDRLGMEAWMGSSDDDNSVLSKLRDQCLRLALLLHLLDAVTDGRDESALVSSEAMRKAILFADWFREHQRHVWALIGNAEHKATEAAPLERRVVAAIMELQDEIKSGVLPTARIAQQVNAAVGEPFQVDVRAIGKACSKLGLGNRRTSNARVTVVDEKALSRIRALANVTNVTNVTKSGQTCDSGRDVLTTNVTNVTRQDNPGQQIGDVCDMTRKNVTAENTRGSKADDVCDVSDVFPLVNEQALSNTPKQESPDGSRNPTSEEKINKYSPKVEV